MRQSVLKRQRDAMTEAGLDALVAISPENFAYTAGFVVPGTNPSVGEYGKVKNRRGE